MDQAAHARIDDAFKAISRTRSEVSGSVARLDGLKDELQRVGGEVADTNRKLEQHAKDTADRFDNIGNDMRDRFADVREDLKDVAVKTSLITGTIVAVVTGSIGGLGIYLVKSTVHSQLSQTPAKTQQADVPASTIATDGAVYRVSR